MTYFKQIAIHIIPLLCINLFAQEQINMIDYILPMEPQQPLVHSGVWGDPAHALPRDTANGLEDTDLSNWVYWDGSIVKDDSGKYHMYASRWDQRHHHSTGWKKYSKAMHATSDSWYGPFVDQGMIWPYWQEGKSHNTMGLRMFDGRYAVVSSEITPGNIFVSGSPNGPFEYLGQIKIDYNGFHPGMSHYNFAPYHMSNVMVFARPDGRYMIIARQCTPLVSDNGILGPYRIMANGVKSGYDETVVPQEKMEDPTVWYSDDRYHVIVAHHPKAKGYHFTSIDGIHHWKFRGIAYDGRDGSMFTYTDGTMNPWGDVQRPTVYVEDGIIKALHYSVLDLGKGEDDGNDNNGSKIVVVPFDGEAISAAMRRINHKEDSIIDATPIPSPWLSVDIGNFSHEGAANYNDSDNVFKIRSAGININDTSDNFRFTYQEVTGDFIITAQVMTQDNTHPWAKAGVMLRSSLNPNSPNAMMAITSRNGALFQYRSDISGTTDSVRLEAPRAPYWVQLVKEGNTITGLVSTSNKLNWTTVGTTTVNLGTGNYYIGLAHCSNSQDSINISRFQYIDIKETGSVDMIISHDLPIIIPHTQNFTYHIEHATTQARDVRVLLRDKNDWNNLVYNVTTTVNGRGTTSVNFVPDIPLKTETRYQWEIVMRHEGGDWHTNIPGTSIWFHTALGVEEININSFQISTDSLTIHVNQRHQLSNIVSPSNASDAGYHWYSDNLNVAQVSWYNGEVSALTPGVANIIVKADNYDVADTCRVNVMPAILVEGVNIDADTIELNVGESVQMEAIIYPENATNKTVKWSVNNSSIARINASGIVTARRQGFVKVTAQTIDGHYSDYCIIKVNEQYSYLNHYSNHKLIICPNPANEYLSISIPDANETATIMLIDVDGRTFFQAQYEKGMKINTANLKGIYFLKIITTRDTLTSKVIIV